MSALRSLILAAASVPLLGVASSTLHAFEFSGLALGISVGNLIAAHGSPEVLTTDVGQIWTWDSSGGTVRITTDDRGIVQVIDVLPAPEGPVSFALPSQPPLIVNFGMTTEHEADLRYGPMAAFSASTRFPDSGAAADVRGYRFSGSRQAVLLFENTSKTLREVFYGDTDNLAYAGFLPASPVTKTQFTAPVLVHRGSSDYPRTKKQGDAFVRIEVDAGGSVSQSTIFTSSGDLDLDRSAIASANSFTFTPATRDGVAVPAVFFDKETFRKSPSKR